MKLSIVVPCFNEEACLPALHDRLSAAAKGVVGSDYEIVLVNDGSRDSSWAIMRRLAATDPRLVAINLSRNHGHQLALTAGLDLCRGDVILVIDADLQDPPELLGDMLATMEREDADVVYGVRKSRAGETAFKRATAHGFYRLLSRATEVDIPLDAGDFRLMSRRALDALLAMPEQARFIRGMVAWIGFNQVPFLYDRQERLAGETKYPLGKMIRFALDALTGFSSAPLKLASHAGLWLAVGSLLLIVYIVYSWLGGRSIGLDVADAGGRRARRCADVRARADGRIYRAPLQRGEAAPALHHPGNSRPGRGKSRTARRGCSPESARSGAAPAIPAELNLHRRLRDGDRLHERFRDHPHRGAA